MTSGLLLTTSSLLDEWAGWAVQPATTDALPHAAGLLIPHDGQTVQDVQHRPDRWALLMLVSGAVRGGLPVLAWGSGAALAGRVLGAAIQARIQTEGGQMEGGERTAQEWAALPRNAHAERWLGTAPLLWRVGNVTAWAGETLPDALRQEFLILLKTPTPRTPATPLDSIGGEAALRPLLTDFYARARADEVLGPVFAAHVLDWEAHLEAVTAFWVTMLGGGAAWRGNLNHIHAPLGVRGVHLARWLALFRAAAEAHLPPDAAHILTARAEAMGKRLGRQRAGTTEHPR